MRKNDFTNKLAATVGELQGYLESDLSTASTEIESVQDEPTKKALRAALAKAKKGDIEAVKQILSRIYGGRK